MQLDEFVTETLKALIKGVNDAQTFAKEHGARVNPVYVGMYGGPKHVRVGRNEDATEVTEIEFDVAVTASTKQESGLSAGISVLSLNLGGKTADTDTHQTVSRIKFMIRAALPSVSPF